MNRVATLMGNTRPAANDAGIGVQKVDSLENAAENQSMHERAIKEATADEADLRPHAEIIAGRIASDPDLAAAIQKLSGHTSLNPLFGGANVDEAFASGAESADNYKKYLSIDKGELNQAKKSVNE